MVGKWVGEMLDDLRCEVGLISTFRIHCEVGISMFLREHLLDC